MDAVSELADPTTPALRLAQIAQAHPEHAAAIAAHPNAYPDLVSWAHLVRGGASATAMDVVADHDRLAPVDRARVILAKSAEGPRWAAVMWGAALAFFCLPWAVLNLWLLVAPDSYWDWWVSVWDSGSVPVLHLGLGEYPLTPFAMISLLGYPAAVVAAAGAPRGRRRIWAVVAVSASVVVVGFVAFMNGGLLVSPFVVDTQWEIGAPSYIACALVAALCFSSWILARPLRGAAFSALPLILVGVLIMILTRGQDFGALLNALSALSQTLIVPASVVALALVLDRAARRHPERRRAEAGPSPLGVGAVSRTNTMAILSLVFAFFVSVLAVVFGHVALGQIRRTGESGRGMAIAGLVLGYVGLAAGAIAVIVWAVAFGALMSYRGY